ncbi:MAG: iron ABC transporter permease [Abditibacteriaceae bacterium]
MRWALLLTCFVVVVAFALVWGAPLSCRDIWSNDAIRGQAARDIFLHLRPTRVLAGILVGAGLAVSGSALQTVFRNPLAEPYLLGVSAGGALGATIVRAFMGNTAAALGGFDPAVIAAFVGALATTFAVYHLGKGSGKYFGGGFDRALLLLVGIAVSAFLASLMTLVVAVASRTDLARIVLFWLMGSLADATASGNWVMAFCLIVGLAIMLSSARDLNALQVSDEEAASLGVDIGKLHRRLLFAAALVSAAAVALAGLIGFIGLLAPHCIRLLFGNDARITLVASAFGGAILLVGCDALARSAIPPVEVPVGIITALIGVPLFLWLARKGSEL